MTIIPCREPVRILVVSALNRGVTLSGFSPQPGLLRKTRENNAQAHGYTCNRMEPRLARQP